MNAPLLTKELHLLAAAPNGVQKLRELILSLAVRGKLVPQDPNDEPALELLKRIRSKDAKLVSSVKLVEQPFSLPAKWEWTLFESIFSLEYGDNLPAPKRTNSGEYPVYGSNGIVGTHSECRVTKPCIVVGRKGSAGALNLCLHKGCWVTDVAYYCIPPSEIDLEFCFKLFHTLGLSELGKGIKPGLSRGEAYSIPVAIPPLAEQRRIVAKVDELMALCNQLEAQQTTQNEAHERLVATLLDTLTQSTDATAFADNWVRAAEHFDLLFQTPESIDKLKQCVLHLAVQGKLVPQDPKDEPVDRTFAGLRSLDSVPEGVESVPNQWALCQYRSLTSLVTSGSRGWKEFYSDTGAIFIRTQNIKTDNLVLDDVAFVSLPKQTEGMRTQVLRNDILITITGANVTKAARVETTIAEAYVSQHIALTRPIWSEMSRWLHLCFISRGSARGILEKLAYGDKPGLSLANVRGLALPIPPLAEQHRIVAKVDELMAICDDLANRLATARELSAKLVTAAAEAAIS